MSVQKWLIGALARQKRQLGNPSGRPKGARNLLSESVLKELTSHWGENGLDAIDRTCKEQPAAYLRAVLSFNVKHKSKALNGDATAQRLAAEQGDADAQFNLGVMYAKGRGVTRR